jgi:[ribosomal protein S5]-alanine N-acetyltransferase
VPEDPFSHPTEIITVRLVLRALRTEDAEAIHEYKSDVDFARCYAQEPQVSLDETKRWVEKNIKDEMRKGSIFWVITLRDSGILIGDLCFWNFDTEHLCAEVGYEMHPDHQGHGFMAEALTAIIDFGFDEMGLHRIEGCPLAENARSRRVLEKLGFTQEGVLRQRLHYRGKFLDHVYYGLLKDEWNKIRLERSSHSTFRSLKTFINRNRN